jgi:hypothetical protein
MKAVNIMKPTTKETLNKKLRQEIRDKANKASELSQKIRQTRSIVERKQLSDELKQIVEEMERIVATLAANSQ